MTHIRNNFFYTLTFSILIHIIFFFSFSIYIKKSSNPVIFSWQDIIRKDDLSYFRIYNDVSGFITDSNFPIDYSFLDIPIKKYFLLEYKDNIYPKFVSREFLKDRSTRDILIFNKSLLPILKDEDPQFKIFIAPYGRVIISFPEKLLVDSNRVIMLEDNIKESIFSIKDKFFWTKLRKQVE